MGFTPLRGAIFNKKCVQDSDDAPVHGQRLQSPLTPPYEFIASTSSTPIKTSSVPYDRLGSSGSHGLLSASYFKEISFIFFDFIGFKRILPRAPQLLLRVPYHRRPAKDPSGCKCRISPLVSRVKMKGTREKKTKEKNRRSNPLHRWNFIIDKKNAK